jgi:hypothetical protein
MLQFTQFQSTNSAFKRTISPADFAAEVKTSQNVPSLTVSNILQGKTDDAKFVVVRLSNGNSATLPASKKSVVGDSIMNYQFAESDKGEWVVVTGASDTTL